MQYTNLINNLTNINNQLSNFNKSNHINTPSQQYIQIIKLLQQLNKNLQPYQLFFK